MTPGAAGANARAIGRRCSIFLVAAVLAGAVAPRFKDTGEYEIAGQVEREHDPVRSLVLLNHWAELYPKSAFGQERSNKLIKAYRALKMGREMRATARQMALEDPYGLGNYWMAQLTISLQDTSAAALHEGRAAAEAMLRNSGGSFAIANCPQPVQHEAWFRERDRHQMLAHRTLGWVALHEDRFPDAEREFATVLRSNPNDAEASFWMGTALIGQKDRALGTAALYHIARSLAVSGNGALLPEARTLVKAFYEDSYTNLTGGATGMKALLEQARSGPFPPTPRKQRDRYGKS